MTLSHWLCMGIGFGAGSLLVYAIMLMSVSEIKMMRPAMAQCYVYDESTQVWNRLTNGKSK